MFLRGTDPNGRLRADGYQVSARAVLENALPVGRFGHRDLAADELYLPRLALSRVRDGDKSVRQKDEEPRTCLSQASILTVSGRPVRKSWSQHKPAFVTQQIPGFCARLLRSERGSPTHA